MSKSKHSAGLLIYRQIEGNLEVLLAHPGGPFWAKKDLGSWSIPKGLCEPEEDPRDAAVREFREETGWTPPGELIPLGSAKQTGGKTVAAWAGEADYDLATFASNTFSMEWPPRSGKMAEFPEIDRVGWFAPPEARERILQGQAEFIDRLVEVLNGS